MHLQSLRDAFLSDRTRDRNKERRPIITPDALEPRGTNAKLWLDKYISFQEQKDDQQSRLPQKQATPPGNSKQDKTETSRSQLIGEVSLLPIPPIYEAFYQRWVQDLDRFKAHYRERCAKGRMILGLGAESVLDTSITLHHTYGVPYIPGSALKGLAASYLRWQFGEKWREDKTKLAQYKVIFGDTNDAGFIIFFDALYIPCREHKGHALQRDIITVHHPDYYKEMKIAGEPGKPDTLVVPADWDNPNPVSFLSVTGYYLIALAAPDLQEQELWINATFAILDNALQHWGIGAKTSSGYGRMEEKKEEIQISSSAQACIDEINKIQQGHFGQRIHYSYKSWQKLEAVKDRLIVARTIIERIEQNRYTQAKAEKEWYQELVHYIQEHQCNK